METSALDGTNLATAFEMIMNQVYEKCHADIENDDLDNFDMGTENIDITKDNRTENKKECC